jgi:hypothetical protein
VQESEADEFLRRHAPVDVQETVKWLRGNGYSLTEQRGGSTFGAVFVYCGATRVVVSVDRSQWWLDVAPTPGADAWQYDLLIAAQAGKPYAEVFPEAGLARPLHGPLPEQLPEHVSWRETLPAILPWLLAGNVTEDVTRVWGQRTDLLWPTS